VHFNIGEFEGVKTAAPVDFATLRAGLIASQSASPTARLAGIVHDRVGSRPKSLAEHAIILFRTEAGWRLAPDAMCGSFHASAAAHLMDKVQ
jgi:hypothetical protein